MKLLAAACAALLVAGVASSAHAQPSPRTVAAEQLFREGRELLTRRHFAEACEKLDASEKLDRAVGTLISLGECYAALGRTASSWFAYRSALALATERDDPRRAAAEARAAAMEPLLATIEVHATDDARITVDGEAFARAVLSAPLPVDPGSHRIEVSAPGFTTWIKVVTVTGPADVASIDVPQLEPLPDASAVQRAHDQAATKRAVGVAVGAAGLLAIGAGAVLGMQAIVKGRDANRACPSGGPCSDPQAVHENDVAKTYADASTVTIPVGFAVTAIGAYLFATAHPVPIETTARVSSSGASVDVGWSW